MTRTYWMLAATVLALTACHPELEGNADDEPLWEEEARPPATVAPINPRSDKDAPAPDAPADPPPVGCGSDLGNAQTDLANLAREAEGLGRLDCHEGLTEVAWAHSKDMAERGFFDHVNPDGERPWDRMNAAGVTGWAAAGENIALGYPSAEAVTEGWMNSPGHRANILNGDFNSVGVGVYEHGGRLYWTQLFARF